MNLRERIARFLYGRNGPDALYRFVSYLMLVLLIVNLFVRSIVLSVFIDLLFAYALFRLLSRNLAKRQSENRRFLRMTERITARFRTLRIRLSDREHVYKKCPECGSQLRLPRRKGTHTARCPRCYATFRVRI